jgi:hypothetical protein
MLDWELARINAEPPGTNLRKGLLDRRSSLSHRHVPTHPEDAAEVIIFASQLLRIVDRLKP